MTTTIRYLLLILLGITLLGGCAADPASDSGEVLAALTLTGAAAPGEVAAGVQLTLNLPAKVAPRLNGDGSVAAGVVSVVGAADPAAVQLLADYVPGSGGSGGSLSFIAVYAPGFAGGDQLRIRLDLLPGFVAETAVFSITGYTVSDPDGHVVSGLQPTVTARYY